MAQNIVQQAIEFKREHINELAAFVAVFATSLSFGLSEMFEIPPCDLCWYQRIFMYPLPFIFLAAIWTKEKRTYLYALPLTLIGGAIAFYHMLVQWDLIQLADTCGGFVSCSDVPINVLGFITIPFGAFMSFAAIAGLLIMQMVKPQQNTDYNAADRLRVTIVASLGAVLVGLIALQLVLN